MDAAFTYNSDDEYVDNLRESGNFAKAALADYKEESGVMRSQPELATNIVLDTRARQELDFYKSYDNIFDLVEDPAPSPGEAQPSTKADSWQFHQMSFENMHKRASQGGAIALKAKKRASAAAGTMTPSKKAASHQTRTQGPRSPAKATAAQKPSTDSARRSGHLLNQGSG